MYHTESHIAHTLISDKPFQSYNTSSIYLPFFYSPCKAPTSSQSEKYTTFFLSKLFSSLLITVSLIRQVLSSNYIQKPTFHYMKHFIFFHSIPFSSPTILVPPVIQVLCLSIHKDIHFNTILWKTVSTEKDRNMSSKMKILKIWKN